ncbi:MAG TPA: hypothetical protein VIE16_05540 [Phenylobacterium sp.]|jgi:hypothetical protein
MPSAYRQDAARLMAEIAARVDAGETVRAVCASPGMPTEQTVRNWAKGDAAFGEALAAARRRAHWRRLWAFDEAKAEAFLARARAGERIRDLLGQPGMPTRGQYHRWRTAQAPFAEATFALRQRSNTLLGDQGRARWRAFDQALADRIIVRMHKGVRLEDVLAADPELPCWDTLARWRRGQPEFDGVLRRIIAAQRAMMEPVDELLVEDVCGHIVEGGSLLSYSRLPGGPSFGTLRRWMRDPNFAARVAKACDVREEMIDVQIWLAAERTPPGTLQEMNRSIGPLLRRQVLARHRPRTPLPAKPRKKPGSPRSRG